MSRWCWHQACEAKHIRTFAHDELFFLFCFVYLVTTDTPCLYLVPAEYGNVDTQHLDWPVTTMGEETEEDTPVIIIIIMYRC